MIRTAKNTLALEWDRWDDPGDYPSGAGSGPLPSEDFACFDGELVLELTDEDAANWREWFAEGYGDKPDELPYDVEEFADAAVRLEHGRGVKDIRWTWEALESRDGKSITVTMSVHEANVPAPEPDYEPWED